MPTYDYRCPQCGKFSLEQSIKAKALENCPTCGAPVQRLIGKNVNILYKCSGFYSTDAPRSPSGPPQYEVKADELPEAYKKKHAEKSISGSADNSPGKAVND